MSFYHPYTIFPLGDASLTIEFSDVIDEGINKKVLHLFNRLQAAALPHITGLIPAYSSLTVCYDVLAIHKTGKTAFETMALFIEKFTQDEGLPAEEKKRLIKVPVCYESSYAPDMVDMAKQKNLSPQEIISIHTSQTYRVYMLGFLPGFAYMGIVDERIEMPRKINPRLNVMPGSVGIAGRQTGIYPLSSPGGWQIIGCTPLKLFDKTLDNPVLFQPGDEIKFYSITANEFENHQSRNA